MAHDSNGRIFIDTSVTPHIGISVSDCQAVFATSRNTFGDVITNEDINKWAKYKPLRSSKLGVLTDAERVELNHGLTMTKYTSPAALVSGYTNDYAYLRPRGKNTYNEWFRRGDFNGYNHNAMGPVQSFACPSGEVTQGQDLIVRLYLNPSSQVPTGSLLWSDINPEDDKPISQYYFGVIIRTGTSSTYRVLTMGTQIGTGYPIQEQALTLPASLFSVGSSYTIYPILSYTAYTTVSSASSYQTGFYSVPNSSPETITITTILRVVSVAITNFSAQLGVGRYTWSLTGAVQVNSGTTISGQINYRIYDGAYDQDTHTIGGSVIDSGEFYYGSFAVAPDQTITTKTGTEWGGIPQYLTAVLSYQGADCLPVTIENE